MTKPPARQVLEACATRLGDERIGGLAIRVGGPTGLTPGGSIQLSRLDAWAFDQVAKYADRPPAERPGAVAQGVARSGLRKLAAAAAEAATSPPHAASGDRPRTPYEEDLARNLSDVWVSRVGPSVMDACWAGRAWDESSVPRDAFPPSDHLEHAATESLLAELSGPEGDPDLTLVALIQHPDLDHFTSARPDPARVFSETRAGTSPEFPAPWATTSPAIQEQPAGEPVPQHVPAYREQSPIDVLGPQTPANKIVRAQPTDRTTDQTPTHAAARQHSTGKPGLGG